MGADLLEDRVRQMVAQKVATADQFYINQKHREALTLYREASNADPGQPRLQFMAGVCAWQVGMYEQAGVYLREAVRLQPSQPMAHHGLADWCIELGDFAGALSHSARALELAPNDPHFAVSRATILDACGKRAEAWEQLQHLLKTSFRSAKLAILYARLAPGTGHELDALNQVIQYTSRPGLSIAEQRMLRLTAAALLDRVGRYDEAFAYAQSGHAVDPNEYDPTSTEQLVSRQIEYFTPSKLHDLPRASHPSRRPVFIVGMPRSGTSLVEQILASHPQVYGAGELSAIHTISTRLCGQEPGNDCYPYCLDSMSLRTADKHAQEYLRMLAELNADAIYVTDKMPGNFLHLGIIVTLFPNAHVIHCTRDPLDTCMSCYLTHFAVGHAYTRDLAHLGAYYRQYQRLMAHWKQALNVPILDVRYEDVIADQPGQAKRMLEYLDLPWDDHCAAFHKTARRVATASRHQVKQPIYSTSVNRWKNYEKHLTPLKAALQCD